MRSSTVSSLFLACLGVVSFLGLLYLAPPIHQRLSWRMDILLTYLRGVVSPVGELPTPVASQVVEPSETPTYTLTPAVTSEPTITPTFQPSPTPLPQTVELPAPKWEKQDWNNCGPAALAMYLRFYGWEGTQFDISKSIKPAREDRNVNIEELAYYARTHAGWLNVQYRVAGNLNLLKTFLANGFPVMIEEEFYLEETYWPNDDHWSAHYQLLTGYDELTKTFIGQDSFKGANQLLPYDAVDKQWRIFNRVYMILYPQQQEEVVKAIIGPDWDVNENRKHALALAQADAEANPNDAFAWFNVGTNLVYFERYGEAARAYDTARTLGLPQRMLRYQFGPFIAYFHAGRTEDLLELADYALKRTPNSEEALLWKGWALYRKGNLREAKAYFQQALDSNPNYQDARYALDFISQ